MVSNNQLKICFRKNKLNKKKHKSKILKLKKKIKLTLKFKMKKWQTISKQKSYNKRLLKASKNNHQMKSLKREKFKLSLLNRILYKKIIKIN